MRSIHLFAAAALVLATPAAATELVVNGSFETGNFGGWTEFGVSNQSFITQQLLGGGPTDGTHHAAFGPVGDVGGIRQILETVPGQSYRIRFDLANIGGGDNLFTADWDGALLTFSFDSTPLNYLNVDTIAVATAETSLINFRFRHAQGLWLMDNVSVTAVAAIPEPASWTMLILGFGMIGAVMRMRLQGSCRMSGMRMHR